MLTRTLRVTGRIIEIPGLEKYRGKLVEVTVKEKRAKRQKNKYKKFYSLCGKIDIDEDKIKELREQSMI